jgi:excisionase family DNA binding protein
VAYSKEEAAKVSGMEVETIDYLIKRRKLPYVKTGSQRGRVILHDDLMTFLMNHRQPSVDELFSKQG